MVSSDPARPPAATDDPALRDALRELVGLGVRIARVAAEAAEAEGRIVAIVVAGLPARVDGAGSMSEAQDAGYAVDSAEVALAQSVPRIAVAAQAFERVARAVRRTAALMQRIECGWPRHGGSDDRRAMARRQIARSVGEVIARQVRGEAAERLFDDLAERLDRLERDGGLDQPVEVAVATICRDLGLVEAPPALGAVGFPAGDAPDG
jgi:hypothetical protein